MNNTSIRDNHKYGNVGDYLKPLINKNCSISIVSAYFTIYAYYHLKERLDEIKNLRFLFGEPTFIRQIDPDGRDYKSYKIEDNHMSVTIQNRLKQKRIALECYEWLKQKAEIKSIVKPNFLHGKMYHITQESGIENAITGSSNFTAGGLGLGGSRNIELNMIVDSDRDRQNLKKWFEEIWNDNTGLVEDVKDEVLKYLSQLYNENGPEFIYFKTLFHIFQKYVEDQEKGGLINERTGFFDSEIWDALYDFNWSAFDLVVVDESHNFKGNPVEKVAKDGSAKMNRAKWLMDKIIKSGSKTRVLLLSATPVNNTLRDLRNQIAFITEGNDRALFESSGVKDISGALKNAQTQFTYWSDPRKNPQRNLKQLLERLDSTFFKILDELTIARSRRHIKNFYDLGKIENFPERLKPLSLYPAIDLKNRFPTYDHLGLHIAMVSGSDTQTTFGKNEYENILTNFSPVAKNRSKMNCIPLEGEIDILIATDCISEGQNLQDCDCIINYDIHWNPVRIIQRFGRIDRLGSINKKIQLINFWPTKDLDSYINLKERVEARMALVDVTATGEDNVLNTGQLEELISEDLKFRNRQLKRLREEVLDLEGLDEAVSLTDFTLDDFRIELLNYISRNNTSFAGLIVGATF